MTKAFKDLPRWLQIVLLAIPFCNYVVEIVLRIFAVIKKASVLNIVMLIVAVFGFGVILGWIDLVLVPILGGNFFLLEE